MGQETRDKGQGIRDKGHGTRGRFLVACRLLLVALFLLFCVSSFKFQVSREAVAETATFTITIIPGPQCYDGQDNDADGKIDYPADPGCSSTSDNNETDPTYCGNNTCDSGESCSFCPADCGTCPGGGGGGGGGGGLTIEPTTSAVFQGRAYPKSTVTLLKDAQVAATTAAGTDANFQISLTGLSAGNFIFAFYAEDYQARRSSLLTFALSVTKGATTQVSGIFLAPTIALDKEEVKRGETISILGQSAPQADITISIKSDEEFFAKTVADKAGIYLHHFDTAILDYGLHYTKSKASIANLEISSFGQIVSFKVSTKTVSQPPAGCGRADLNCDGRVNLVDFSIAAYWYKRPLSEEFRQREAERLNGDGKVDLVDFSIMAYWWTG